MDEAEQLPEHFAEVARLRDELVRADQQVLRAASDIGRQRDEIDRLRAQHKEQLDAMTKLYIDEANVVSDLREQVAALADSIQRVIVTIDGRVLAAMIREGVTGLDSHVRYAFTGAAQPPVAVEDSRPMVENLRDPDDDGAVAWVGPVGQLMPNEVYLAWATQYPHSEAPKTYSPLFTRPQPAALTDQQIVEHMRTVFVTGSNMIDSAGRRLYRSVGTQSNVFQSDLIEFARAIAAMAQKSPTER